jgi:hypothetical protein
MNHHITHMSAVHLLALARDVIEKNGVFWFHSRGDSMLPDLGDGELVAVAAVAKADIQVGDVLLCDTSHTPVLHRVSKRITDGEDVCFVLRSDAGNQIHLVTPSQVVGRLVAARRSPVRLAKWHLKQLVKTAAHILLPEAMQPARIRARFF